MSDSAIHVGSGKVRELYALDDDRLLLVASDRISTFDVVLPTEITDKGRVLTGLSAFWFARTRHLVPNHLLSLRDDARSTECKRLEMLPIECVVRGYLAGSGWKDYLATGSVCGHSLPSGLVESQRLPQPIFTPATKAQSGHDENIDRDAAAELIGKERLRRCRADLARALRVRVRSRPRPWDSPRGHEARVRARRGRPDRARRRGVHARLVALLAGGRVRAGDNPAVLRQAVRPRLLRVARLGQDRSGPELPESVVTGTRARYVEAFERLTEISFDDYLADPTVVLG